jgi:deoxyribodipyrimidine photo-lyase
MIQSHRLSVLADRPERAQGAYVLYWMQQSQRAAGNPALEYAVERANALDLPVLVAFALMRLGAGARHYAFMVEGLREVQAALETRGIGFVVRRGDVDPVVTTLARDAALVVCDAGYLRPQRRWRETLAEAATCRIEQVEGDVVVPVAAASTKHEYAARTLRPKLHRLWEDYLVPLHPRRLKHRAGFAHLRSDVDLGDFPALARDLRLDASVAPVRRFQGGEGQARRRLAAFLDEGLARYDQDRNRPERHAVSELSPYLHFGQISPVEIALAVRGAEGASPGKAAYLEELIVRRELAINHAVHTPGYNRYQSLPEWSRKALAKAGDDPRPHLYRREELEAGRTHDRYWNAAMREMTATGYMHNRLRMYWGKKVLQWSRTPQEAFATLLAFNNRWFLDGRDANSYTNVAWIFGLHDRPWGPQPVFGTVRSMGPNTFKSFDAEAYVGEVDRLAAAEDRSA